RDTPGGGDVWVVPATGGAPRRLSRDASANGPSWNADGTQLAYNSQAAKGGEGSIVVIPVAGGTPSALAFDGYVDAGEWAPKGPALAFSGHDPAGFDIYVQPARDKAPIKLSGDPAWEVNPKWSPDGSQIAFASQK